MNSVAISIDIHKTFTCNHMTFHELHDPIVVCIVNKSEPTETRWGTKGKMTLKILHGS